MNYRTYSEIIKTAESPFPVFRSRWLLMPESESIQGFDPNDLDKSTEILRKVYEEINLPLSEIRAASGLSQREFADRFAIPFRTVQNWEARGSCPVYLKILLRQSVGLPSLLCLLGVEE